MNNSETPVWLDLMPDEMAGGPLVREKLKMQQQESCMSKGTPGIQLTSSPGYKLGGLVRTANAKLLKTGSRSPATAIVFGSREKKSYKAGGAVTASLSANDEKRFKTWYNRIAKENGLDPNPDNPKHFYDYRRYWKDTGGTGEPEMTEHGNKRFPDEYKLPGHPNMNNLFADGGYTGDEGTHIDPNKPAGIVHGGEFVINAPVVSLLGGPDKTKQLVYDNARNAIDRARGTNKDTGSALKPIVGKGEALPPVSMAKPAEDKSNLLPGYKWGDIVKRASTALTAAKDRVVDAVSNRTITSSNTPPEVNQPLQADNGSIDISTPNTLNGSNEIPFPEQPKTPLPMETVSLDLGDAPIPPPDPNRDAQKKRFDELVAGGMDPIQANTIALNYRGGTNTAGAPVTTGTTNPNALINQGVNAMQDLAQGKGALIESIINQAFQKYGMDTVGANSELQMRLGAAGITGAPAQAIQDSYARNARIGAQNLQGQLGTEVLKQAMGANESLIRVGQSERTHQLGLKQAAMSTALATKNYAEYAKLAKEVLGIDVDPSILQSEAAAGELEDGMNTISKLYTTFGSKMDLTTPGAKAALEKLWRASPDSKVPGAQMSDEWANGQLQKFKDANNPSLQILDAYSRQDAVTDFFDGSEDALDEFQFGSYPKGYESFQQGMAHLLRTGAMEMNEDGTFTPSDDPEKIALMEEFFSVKEPPARTTIPATTTFEVGATFKDPTTGKEYTVSESANGVVTQLEADGKRYSVSVKDGNYMIGSSSNIPAAEKVLAVGDKFDDQDAFEVAGAKGFVKFAFESGSDKVGKDSNGNFWIQRENGDIEEVSAANFKQVSESMPSETEAEKTAKKNFYKNYAISHANKTVGGFKDLLKALGTVPDAEVINAFLAASDSEAAAYGADRAITNSDYRFSNNATVLQHLKDKALRQTWEDSAIGMTDGTRYGGPPAAGTIMKDGSGRPFIIDTTDYTYKTILNGDDRRNWTIKIRYLDDGSTATRTGNTYVND